MQSKLLVLRLERELTVKEMAEAIGVTEQSYRNREKGRLEFKLSEIFKISDLFGLPIDEIFLPRKFGVTEYGGDKSEKS